MSEQLKFYRGNESNLSAVIPEAGALYHCEDTGNTYLGKENSSLDVFSTAFTYSEAEANATVPINADTLGGHPSSDYVLVEDLENITMEAGYGLGATSNPISISKYELDTLFETGWYSITLTDGTEDFDDGWSYSTFLLRVETGDCNPYINITKQTAMFAIYPGGEEYVRYCKNMSEWTEWKKVSYYSKTLLWENASWTYGTFLPQIIYDLDLDYDYIEIIFRDVEGSGALCSTGMIPMQHIYAGRLTSAHAGDVYSRYFKLLDTKDGIEFEDAYRNSDIANYEIVPYRIYGIKGVM